MKYKTEVKRVFLSLLWNLVNKDGITDNRCWVFVCGCSKVSQTALSHIEDRKWWWLSVCQWFEMQNLKRLEWAKGQSVQTDALTEKLTERLNLPFINVVRTVVLSLSSRPALPDNLEGNKKRKFPTTKWAPEFKKERKSIFCKWGWNEKHAKVPWSCLSQYSAILRLSMPQTQKCWERWAACQTAMWNARALCLDRWLRLKRDENYRVKKINTALASDLQASERETKCASKAQTVCLSSFPLYFSLNFKVHYCPHLRVSSCRRNIKWLFSLNCIQ